MNNPLTELPEWTEEERRIAALLQQEPLVSTSACYETEVLLDLIVNKTNAPDAAEKRDHLADCAHCAAEFAALAKAYRIAGELASQPVLPARMVGGVGLAQAKSTRMAQTVPTFTLRGDRRTRGQIIEHYAYLVKITAGRVIGTLPLGLERDDLVSAGIMGLIKAVDQYDASRKVKFETYAIALIRGAILEMLRAEDWVPRATRERVGLLQRTYINQEMELGRPAREDEMAAAMNVRPEEFQKLVFDAGRTYMVSLEDVLASSNGGEDRPRSEVFYDDGITPTLGAELREQQRLLSEAIDRLPERERQVVSLYYYEGMTFKEIGKTLAISDTRSYQLHTQAVLRLRGYLQRDKELF